MAWFKYVGDEVALPWKQWRDARRDPSDLAALNALGARVLEESAGQTVASAELRRVQAIAHLLHYGFKGKSSGFLKATAESLEGRAAPGEPRLWDPPHLMREAHRRLVLKSKIEPLAAQALLLGDELDVRIRPGLLRASWILGVAIGSPAAYRDAMFDPALKPRSLSYAVQGLRTNLVPPGPSFLSPKELKGIVALVNEAEGFRSGHLTPDDVIRCIRTGSFRYSEGWIELIEGTEWMLISPGELKRKLRKALLVASVLEAEKVMLLAQVASSVGGLRPKGVSVQSIGCDKKGPRTATPRGA